MKIVIAITGASGAPYAKRVIDRLSKISAQSETEYEIAIVFSKTAKEIWNSEVGDDFKEDIERSIKEYSESNFYAPFASGSSVYDAMIIVPCSMGTLGKIASGVSDSLITRAADVALKERKRLIVVPRETPYNRIHLTKMLALQDAGAIICPATPSFYQGDISVDRLIDSVVDRILDLIGISDNQLRWGLNH